MMDESGFLPRLARQFADQYKNEIHQLIFVFPTHRASYFFRHHLQQSVSGYIWSPEIVTMNDFMSQLADLRSAQTMDLIFDLYQVYQKTASPSKRGFADFYYWGKMLIADFDEIDKYLLDTDELFRVLSEYKSVEEIDWQEKSKVYKNYLRFWDELHRLYHQFRQGLGEKKIGYEGMVYRQVAENDACLDSMEAKKVIFCGFNALTPAEEMVIEKLIQRQQAETFWDMDHYFIDDELQEAGFFFRKKDRHLLGNGQIQWIDNCFLQEKKIRIFGVQSQSAQAKLLGMSLAADSDQTLNWEDVAVVIPDQTMLFPVLNALPEEIDTINVTLGYPLLQTPVFSLFTAVYEMHQNAAGDSFHYQDVLRILHHPYIQPLMPERIRDFVSTCKRDNVFYIRRVDFLPPAIGTFLNQFAHAHEIVDAFLNGLEYLRGFFTNRLEGSAMMDLEFLYHFWRLLIRFKEILTGSGADIDLVSFWKLFYDIISDATIPFTGEPLAGLQVMGMLETQVLNFKKIFILSCNEGILPPHKKYLSFIPHDLRKQVGLPGASEQSAVVAYHFYRLLKYADEIHLFYVTDSQTTDKEEKSRFIDQLLLEYAYKNPQGQVDHQLVDFPFSPLAIKKIVINKTDAMIDTLLKKQFSATSIHTYLTCPLKFYFNYLLGIKEEEEVSESPDSRMVGIIIHRILELAYKPFLDQSMTLPLLEEISNPEKMLSLIRQVYAQETGIKNIDWGRNRILQEVISFLLGHFFSLEKSIPGFRMLGLEKRIDNVPFAVNVRNKAETVKLKGFIDRYDFLSPCFRVVDYKTGKIQSCRINDLNDLATDGALKRKEAFQLLFYFFLLSKLGGLAEKKFRLGVFSFKDFSQGWHWVNVGKESEFDAKTADEFAGVLASIFSRIFSPDTPFFQTEDEARCRLCPYHLICGRYPLNV